MDVEPDDCPIDDDFDREAFKRQVIRRCRFVPGTFEASASLVALEPTGPGFVAVFPYTGQDYDPTRWRLVPNAWDHDHCFLCMAHILPGDAYWPNDGPDQVALCEACHAQHRDAPEARPEQG